MNWKASRTPADTSTKLGPSNPSVDDLTLYISLACALQYLTFTRPDIDCDVHQFCLFMHEPREPHFTTLHRILRYIWGLIDHGLQLYISYARGLIAYFWCWLGWWVSLIQSLHIWILCLLGQILISWLSKRQGTMSRSIVEAEYRGLIMRLLKHVVFGMSFGNFITLLLVPLLFITIKLVSFIYLPIQFNIRGPNQIHWDWHSFSLRQGFHWWNSSSTYSFIISVCIYIHQGSSFSFISWISVQFEHSWSDKHSNCGGLLLYICVWCI